MVLLHSGSCASQSKRIPASQGCRPQDTADLRGTEGQYAEADRHRITGPIPSVPCVSHLGAAQGVLVAAEA